MATISDILQAQGRQAAEARRTRGGVWSSILPQLANLPNQIMADRQAERAAQEEGFNRQQVRDVNTQRLRAGQREEGTAEQAASDEQAMAEVFGSPGIIGEDGGVDLQKAAARAQEMGAAHLVPRFIKARQEFDEGVAKVALTVAQTASANRANQPTPPADFTLSPGQQRFGADGAPLASVPAEEKPDTRSLQQQANDALRKGDTAGYAQIMKVLRETSAAGRDPRPAQGSRSPIWVMMDGKFLDLAGVAPAGSQPASSREQGRPVTSGDAGRMADFDTSLSDLGVLNKTLTETAGATGTAAAIGASMPAWATDMFGWGVDAKKRQGVIDRVKQVIGKTLEGGVLRKEDEIKYEKILPTIKDTAAVAKSKLAGLETAITQRRSTFMDALGDAGYDTARFAERGDGKIRLTTDPTKIAVPTQIGRFTVTVGEP